MAVSETARLLASLELKDLFTKQIDNATKSLGKLDTKLDQSQSRAYRAGQQIGTGIKRGLAIGITALGTAAVVGGTVFAKAIKSASDLSETLSKVGVVFGKSSTKVLEFGKTSAEALGLSQQAADEAAATYGNLFVSMGFAQQKSADMSVALVKLASDLASFNNIDPAEALDKLRSGLTGEFEPLKTLGVNINDTILKAEALKLGLVKLEKGQKTYTAVLTPAQKAQAAYALIFEQTKTAQGDFARTQGGLANQTRILKANWEDLKATLATPVLPKIALIFQRINAALKENQPAVAKLGDTIASFFTKENIDAGFGVIKSGIDTLVAAAPILEASAKATLGFVQAGVAVFNSLPDPIKALAVGGFALNKLTGGLVTNIGGALIDLIGKSRGASPANPVFVSDVTKAAAGAAGDVAGKAGLAGLASGVVALLGVGAVEIAIAGVAGDWLKANVPGWGTPQGAATVGPVVIGGESEAQRLHRIVAEQKAAEDLKTAAANLSKASEGTNNVQPGAILDRGGREQGFNVLAGKIRDDANYIADVMKAIGDRQAKAIDTLRHTNDPKAILGALKDIEEITIKAGHGNLQTAQREAAAIRRQLRNVHDPATQAALRKALRDVEGKIPGREYAQRQIAKANDILHSSRSVDEKIRGLQAIENDLKNHKLPGQTRALQAKIDALKASNAKAQAATAQAIRDKKAQVVIQNQIDAVTKIDSKVIGREVRRISRLYAIPI